VSGAFRFAELYIAGVSPAIGTHVGPGTVGIAFTRRSRGHNPAVLEGVSWPNTLVHRDSGQAGRLMLRTGWTRGRESARVSYSVSHPLRFAPGLSTSLRSGAFTSLGQAAACDHNWLLGTCARSHASRRAGQYWSATGVHYSGQGRREHGGLERRPAGAQGQQAEGGPPPFASTSKTRGAPICRPALRVLEWLQEGQIETKNRPDRSPHYQARGG